jgi:hypothetical protein
VKELLPYYLGRASIAAAFAALVALLGAPWWGAVIAGIAMFGLFVWAVRSGRYVVRPEHGVTALRSDEYTRAVRDRATRYGFVAVTLALGAVTIYYGLIASTAVPVSVVGGILFLGWAVYYITDVWSRRS